MVTPGEEARFWRVVQQERSRRRWKAIWAVTRHGARDRDRRHRRGGEWQQQIDLNITGAMRVIHEASPTPSCRATSPSRGRPTGSPTPATASTSSRPRTSRMSWAPGGTTEACEPAAGGDHADQGRHLSDAEPRSWTADRGSRIAGTANGSARTAVHSSEFGLTTTGCRPPVGPSLPIMPARTGRGSAGSLGCAFAATAGRYVRRATWSGHRTAVALAR